MTIKQHGGIFGRNPTFNNVEVDGEATLSSAKITDLTNNRIVVVGAGGEIEDDANLSWDGSQFNVSNGTVTLFATQGSSANAMRIGVGGNVSAVLEHRGYAGQNFLIQDETVASITAAGNLAFTSGRGIDFSATSGTGTSELFDDYEEGTWTPTGISAGTVDQAKYTKIGNVVTITLVVSGAITLTSGTIGGLPYTAITTSCPWYLADFAVGSGEIPMPTIAGTNIYLRTASQTTGAYSTLSDLTGTYIAITATYHV
jgi:hypothetical protein